MAKRVLIVEDYADSARTLAAVLEQMGHAVDYVLHPIVAIEAALLFKPDVMLVDITMPGIDGWTLATMIRKRPELAGVTLYALTAYNTIEDQTRSAMAGFDLHLAKPVDLARLKQLLT